ncbi:MAG: preprotein translocase subunit YajC [Ruminococcaceae bacterium]|nr:preprotein translocase subunit YajC [Oscillospiraceae bacterium]
MFNFGFLLATSGSLLSIGMIVLLFVFLYFFMIRPQKKQEKKDAEMRDGLEVGDEVTTIGGIIGKVVSIKGETFVLETTKDKTKIRFLKGAIRTVDVKAADVAAQIMEANKEAEEPAEEEAKKQ